MKRRANHTPKVKRINWFGKRYLSLRIDISIWDDVADNSDILLLIQKKGIVSCTVLG